jgi:histone acetyltransferase (RNA polymerase elongator complex component)
MPFVIPVFIPHQGCPHTCIFCDQHRISGQESGSPVTVKDVHDIIVRWLDRKDVTGEESVQVAFYGGSFTGLPFSRQTELLGAVKPFLGNGRVHVIRISTRPDYVQSDTIAFLRKHGVSIVELGAQSFDDKVLKVSHRGHTAEDTDRAVALLQQGGMQVGLQLMLGLPGQTARSLMQTVKRAATLRPDFIRIYPVLVLKKSKLNTLYTTGTYTPLSLDKAVVQAAWMKKYFDVHGIRVVRMGLQPGPELERNLVAGPYHPAFGELVHARIMLQKTRKELQSTDVTNRQVLSISSKDESIFRGVYSGNIKRLRELGLAENYLLVRDQQQQRYTLKNITDKALNP